MSKMLISFFVFTSLFASFAKASFETTVTPELPVNCLVENSDHVSWIYLLNKESEDDSKVTFSFIVSQGACRNKIISLNETLPNELKINFVHYGLILPWNKDNAIVSKAVSFGGNDQVKVYLSFDKKKLFSHKNSHKFQMNLFPSNFSALNFSWTLVISKNNANNETILNFVNN
jgi:hypothetical protein